MLISFVQGKFVRVFKNNENFKIQPRNWTGTRLKFVYITGIEII